MKERRGRGAFWIARRSSETADRKDQHRQQQDDKHREAEIAEVGFRGKGSGSGGPVQRIIERLPRIAGFPARV